jgi:uncharacterized protein
VLPRPTAQAALRSLLRQFPVVALLGARQVGKSTLARQLAATVKNATHFDLESTVDLARLEEPMLALGELRSLVVLDEIQRRPELFPTLRVLVDRPRVGTRFLVLGSASPALLRQSSESLAGRIAFLELDGFGVDEVGASGCELLWLRGGFPRSYLAPSDVQSMRWRQQFIDTFLERDLPALGFRLPTALLGRFWRMLAHCHGQLWNGSDLGRSLGVTDAVVRRYLDVLSSCFAVRVLPPFFENLAKRQVKAPKVYVADPGILHALLGIPNRAALEVHSRLGASFEGFAIREIIRHQAARRDECFFWRTHDGAELDLLIVQGQRRLGFEIKRTDAPKVTPSMRHALADLHLDSLTVVHAGQETFPMGERIRAVPLAKLVAQRAARKIARSKR